MEEEENEENILKKAIDETFHHMITHDKKELDDLLEQLENEEDFAVEVQELKTLIDEYIENEFRGNTSIMSDIKNRLVTLSNSENISKTTLHRVEMLLQEIERNRYRVNQVLQRMSTVLKDGKEKELMRMLMRLAREELLSQDQFMKLVVMKKDLDFEKLISVIKETKIGRGLDFMPRKTIDLWNQLKVLLSEFGKEQTAYVKSKVLALMDELVQRKEFTIKGYNIMKHLNNIE